MFRWDIVCIRNIIINTLHKGDDDDGNNNNNNNNSGKVFPVHNTIKHRGKEVWIYRFLTSALNGGEKLTVIPGRFNPQNKPHYLLNRRTC